MYYKIRNTDCYYETNKDVILDIVNNKILEEDDDKNITITINGYKVTKRKVWFKYLALFGISLPFNRTEYYNYLDFVDAKPTGSTYGMDMMPILRKPIEFIIDSISYRLIPRYSRYIISRDGDILDLTNLRSINKHLSNLYGYYCYSIIDSLYEDRRTTVSINRLVGLAWVDNDDYVKRSIVDHIDGNKLNNHCSNLRWVTHSENILLRENPNTVITTNTIEIRDRYSGKTLTFNSQNELYKKFGRLALPSIEKGVVILTEFKGKEYLVRKNNEGDWDNFTDYRGLRYFGGIIDLEAKNITTGEIFRSDSCNNLAKDIGVSPSSVSRKITLGQDNILINNTWLVRRVSEDKWADETGDITQLTNFRSEPVSVLCITDGTVETFQSKKEAGRAFNKTNHQINNHLQKQLKFVHNGKLYQFQNIENDNSVPLTGNSK